MIVCDLIVLFDSLLVGNDLLAYLVIVWIGSGGYCCLVYGLCVVCDLVLVCCFVYGVGLFWVCYYLLRLLIVLCLCLVLILLWFIWLLGLPYCLICFGMFRFVLFCDYCVCFVLCLLCWVVVCLGCGWCLLLVLFVGLGLITDICIIILFCGCV